MISNTTARLAGLVLLTSVLAGGAVGVRHALAQGPSAPKPPAMPTPKPPVKLPPNVVARVNGKDITVQDLLGLIDTVHGRPVISEMVKDRVIEDTARNLHVTISEGELDDAISRTKLQIVAAQQRNGQSKTYEEFARENGITPTFIRWSVYEETLKHDTFVKALSSQIPTLDNQIQVAHILIATMSLTDPNAKPPTPVEQQKLDADAKTKIDGILADIKAGKISFEDAAKKYSDDKSNAAGGGQLPYAARGAFDKDFENAAWDLKAKGDISAPVKSKFGWHIIKLISKGNEATAEEKKKYHDEQMLHLNQQADNQQSVEAWLRQVMMSAKVDVNPLPTIIANPKSPLSGALITK